MGYFFSTFLPESALSLIERLSLLSITDNAAEAHASVSTFFEAEGFICTWEFPVADRGDGQSGKIDLFAVRSDFSFAIEIDNTSPRKKSLFKLRELDNVFRLVILRRGTYSELPDGIHVLVNLQCERRPRRNKKRFSRGVSRDVCNDIRSLF